MRKVRELELKLFIELGPGEMFCFYDTQEQKYIKSGRLTYLNTNGRQKLIDPYVLIFTKRSWYPEPEIVLHFKRGE
jgi:hypothetical protein